MNIPDEADSLKQNFYMQQINGKLDKLTEVIKTQSLVIIRTQKDIADLRAEIKQIHEEPNIISEAVENLREDIKSIREEPIISNKTIKPKNLTQTTSEVNNEPPRKTHCLIVGTDNSTDTSEQVMEKISDTLDARRSRLHITKLRKFQDQRIPTPRL